VASQSPVSLGSLNPSSTWGEYNNIIFAVQQAINKLQTATLVRIESCTNDGDLSPVGFVDVTPLVNQIDGANPPNSFPHVTVYGLPYLRLQGGANAVIIDPQPGDIGVAVFASRDISKVKSTKAQANPGSFRSYDFADGLYLGGMLNGVPQQYVRFSSSGITIVAPNTITLQAPNIVLNGALAQSGGDVTIAQKLTATGDIKGAGISLQTHTHTSAAPGVPTSEPIP
jgi:phage baseplate assembly protein gpV